MSVPTHVRVFVCGVCLHTRVRLHFSVCLHTRVRPHFRVLSDWDLACPLDVNTTTPLGWLENWRLQLGVWVRLSTPGTDLLGWLIWEAHTVFSPPHCRVTKCWCENEQRLWVTLCSRSGGNHPSASAHLSMVFVLFCFWGRVLLGRPGCP